MSGYTVYPVGTAGLEYIREQLALGHTLARLLLHRKRLDAGSAITFFPADVEVDPRSLQQFAVGGKLPAVKEPDQAGRPAAHGQAARGRMVPIPNTSAILATIISEHLVATSSRVCVFEDANTRPSDPVFHRIKTPVFTFENEVYHFARGGAADSGEIQQLIRAASSWLVIGVLAALPSGVVLENRSEVPDATLDALASGAEKIIVGAYDGEGYVIWSEPNGP